MRIELIFTCPHCNVGGRAFLEVNTVVTLAACPECNGPIAFFLFQCLALHPNFFDWSATQQREGLNDLLKAAISQVTADFIKDHHPIRRGGTDEQSPPENGPITAEEIRRFTTQEMPTVLDHADAFREIFEGEGDGDTGDPQTAN